MLYEQPLSFVLTGGALAIVLPESFALLQQQGHVHGTRLLFGAVIGAAGVFLGSTIARSFSNRSARIIRITAWTLVGIGLSIGVGIGALHAPGFWNKVVLGGACLLPLAGPVTVLTQIGRETVK